MSNRTITRADLSESVYSTVGLSRAESGDLVEAVLDEMSEAILRERRTQNFIFWVFLGPFQKGTRGP